MTEPKPIERSALLMLAFQLEGICTGLKLCIDSQIAPGDKVKQLISNVRNDVIEMSSGNTMDNIPDLEGEITLADLVILAETLRSTVMAFLTPVEREEHGKSFGFNQ